MSKKFSGQPIPVSLYKAMIEEYKKQRLPLIKEKFGIDDTTTVWFSKKTIDEIFKAAGVTEENSDKFGLEIHYGVVPQDREGVDIPDSYVGRHNVILLATNDDAVVADDEASPYDNGNMCPPMC